MTKIVILKEYFFKKNEWFQLNIYIYIYIYATPLFRTYEFHKTVGVWGPWSIHYKWKYIYIYIYIMRERERERERDY